MVDKFFAPRPYPAYASKCLFARQPTAAAAAPSLQRTAEGEEDDFQSEQEDDVIKEESQEESSKKRHRHHCGHNHHHGKHKHKHPKKHKHKHPKKHRKHHTDDEMSEHDSTGDESSSSSSSSEEPKKKTKKPPGSHEKRMHDQMVAKSMLPIFELVLNNAQVRSCGRCDGCKPCGKCANCLKNDKNDKERLEKIRKRVETDPAFAALPQKKQMSMEKKKKKLKCTETVCTRFPNSSSKSKKMLVELKAKKEKIDLDIASMELVRSGIFPRDGFEGLMKKEAALKREQKEIERMSTAGHVGLAEGHSYALRMMKINHRHMRSVARELVSRGDMNDTGAQRRKNRDLAIKVLIMTANGAKDVLMGGATEEEWESAIKRSKQFLTGGRITPTEKNREEEYDDDEEDEEEEEEDAGETKMSFFTKPGDP